VNSYPRIALRVALALALFLGALSFAPAGAETPALPDVAPASAAALFTAVWIGDSATLSDDTLKQAADAVARQEPDPQHIVVLIHGFATPRANSTREYQKMSADFVREFKKRGKRVAVVGVQWNSDVGAPKLWLVKVVTATLGLDDNNPYLRKVALAENVGRTGLRQLVERLHQRFPGAAIDMCGHSLGCDVARNFVAPLTAQRIKKINGLPEPTAEYAPTELLPLNLLAFCGADVDYDLLYRNKEVTEDRGAVGLWWITVGGIRHPDNKDLVLSIRALARGDYAMGNSIPRMSRGQINTILSHRRLYLDGDGIPQDHEILRYYDATRIANIVDAAVGVADPSYKCAALELLDQIIQAPDDAKVLEKFFSHRNLAAQYYTLWRMELLVCGQPEHLADGYLEWLRILLADDPKAVGRQRWVGPCRVVRKGYWPTPDMITDATEALPGLEGRPHSSDPAFGFP
jgi:hypothetical protein